MNIKNPLSKEKIVNSFKKLGKLRIKTDHSTILTLSALTLILLIAFTIRLFPIRWEIQTGSMHLSEFDPYYQFSLTRYMVKNGLISPYWPTQWVDKQRWYPDGINMARSYPALPMTAAFLYDIISALGVRIELMSFCALFPPIMGMLACLIIYFLGKDIGGKPVGLLAALFLALNPSYIQRTSLGFFDDETIGIVAFLLFMLFFLRSIENTRPLSSSLKYALAAGAALGYLSVGWGASLYPIGVTVLFTFVLILLKRYTKRLLLSYSLTFGLGLFIAISIPKLSASHLTTIAILPVAGVFILLCLAEVFQTLKSTKWKIISIIIFLAALIAGFTILWEFGYMRGVAGKFISVVNPFAREAHPIIESVAEHRISAWGSIYYDLGIAIPFFAVGLFFTLENLNNKNIFMLILGLTSLYFACSMVRLLVLMAPVFSILAAIGILGVLRPFNTLLKETPKISAKKFGLGRVGKEFSGIATFLIFLILTANFAFPMPYYRLYRQVDTPITITAGSLPIAPAEPVREWLDMLEWVNNNLQSTTVVCSWWDYGYWLTLLGNVTSLADNATINTTQIENIGFIFMANETQALKMLKLYDAEYILVFVTIDANGNWLDGGGGDNGKWMWMARISGKHSKRFVDAGFIDEQSAWTNETAFGAYNPTSGRWEWNKTGMSSTIYKLMSWAKHQWCVKNGRQDSEEREWSKNGLSATDIQPRYFKEAFIAGLDLSPSDAQSKYGGIVPLVCLYRIDWQTYYNDYPEQQS